MEERPHEYAALAKAGIKQYQFSWSRLRKESGQREEAGTTATAELTGKEYSEVTSDLDRTFTKGTKRKPSKPPREPEPEEAKRLKSVAQQRANLVKKCKSLIDKCATEAASTTSDLDRLKAKGYPAAMLDWLSNQIVDVQNAIATAQKSYGSEAMKVLDIKTEAMDAYTSSIALLNQVMKTLDDCYQGFRNNVYSDVKKLSS